MLTLRKKQSIFVKLTIQLLIKAHALGFEVTFGHALRSKVEAARLGFPGSLHVLKLAIDLNLFKNGAYCSSTAAHRELGEWWEQQSTDEVECCWGGRFKDGNHYSLRHGNRR